MNVIHFAYCNVSLIQSNSSSHASEKISFFSLFESQLFRRQITFHNNRHSEMGRTESQTNEVCLKKSPTGFSCALIPAQMGRNFNRNLVPGANTR